MALEFIGVVEVCRRQSSGALKLAAEIGDYIATVEETRVLMARRIEELEKARELLREVRTWVNSRDADRYVCWRVCIVLYLQMIVQGRVILSARRSA